MDLTKGQRRLGKRLAGQVSHHPPPLGRWEKGIGTSASEDEFVSILRLTEIYSL